MPCSTCVCPGTKDHPSFSLPPTQCKTCMCQHTIIILTGSLHIQRAFEMKTISQNNKIFYFTVVTCQLFRLCICQVKIYPSIISSDWKHYLELQKENKPFWVSLKCFCKKLNQCTCSLAWNYKCMKNGGTEIALALCFSNGNTAMSGRIPSFAPQNQ